MRELSLQLESRQAKRATPGGQVNEIGLVAPSRASGRRLQLGGARESAWRAERDWISLAKWPQAFGGQAGGFKLSAGRRSLSLLG